MDPMIWREAPLETVLCVLDASSSATALADPLTRAGLRAADVVALTKTDLADGSGLARALDAAKAARPGAVVVEAPFGAVPPALLFAPDVDRVMTPREVGKRRPAADRFETVSWTSDRTLSLPRFQAAIGRLAGRVARAKGIFECVERPGRRVVFQLAGGRATLEVGGAAESGVARAQVVFVVEVGAITGEEISQALDGCTDAEAV
jgi:G3E family GTPase